ncbi:MAG: hypothetical protein ACXVPD_06730 [Bacteroidia bacterium]
MKLLQFIICMCISWTAFGQDAVFLTNGDIHMGQVTEVTADQVKFTKVVADKEALYAVNKSDVKKIEYKSGKVLTFKSGKADADLPPVELRELNQKIEIRSTKLYCNTIKLTDKKFFTLLQSMKDQELSKQLMPDFLHTKKLKKRQHVYMYVGAGITFGCLYTGYQYDAAGFGAVMALTGAVFGTIPSIILYKKRVKKQAEIARRYNAAL